MPIRGIVTATVYLTLLLGHLGTGVADPKGEQSRHFVMRSERLWTRALGNRMRGAVREFRNFAVNSGLGKPAGLGISRASLVRWRSGALRFAHR